MPARNWSPPASSPRTGYVVASADAPLLSHSTFDKRSTKLGGPTFTLHVDPVAHVVFARVRSPVTTVVESIRRRSVCPPVGATCRRILLDLSGISSVAITREELRELVQGRARATYASPESLLAILVTGPQVHGVAHLYKRCFAEDPREVRSCMGQNLAYAWLTGEHPSA